VTTCVYLSEQLGFADCRRSRRTARRVSDQLDSTGASLYRLP